jgi:hypothetical protein
VRPTQYLTLATSSHLLLLDDIPSESSFLRISIDPRKAVRLGVKFFHTKHVELVASGDWNRTIPFEAFKSVAIVQFDKETLKNDLVPSHDHPPATRTEQKAEDSTLQPPT